MHSSNTFITRLGLYNHVVLVWRLWRDTRESLQQPVQLNIEIHENMWSIQLTTMLNTAIADAA